ncbi:MAG TPA: formate dehydrogenase subunit alpha [Hyphomicrobium sp.]|nr:formate dehydrogenase subunit alpha [Hyphomicrobium sp.]
MTLIKETDYGTKTPEVHETTKMVTLEIDGLEVTVPEGTSIMNASMQLGIQIPKLCATDSLDAFGSCRLCLCEIEGRKGTPASCTTPVAPGIKVTTQNARLAKLRRGVMELYISDHPLDCLTCAANGDCELQDMAGAVGLREVRYGFDGENHVFAKRADGSENDRFKPKDVSNPYFQFEPSKCIVCSRCVRACEEVQGTFALTIDGRGFASHVSAGMDESFLASECVSCGACVQACPTATLIEKSVVDIGQAEHTIITTCAYCGVGCSFKAEMRGEEVVRMVPYKDGGANEGHSCVKGRFAFSYATHKDRITTPMIREKITDPWQIVTFDEAINFAAKRFKETQEKYGRKSIGAVTSSRTTLEEIYSVQKLVRAAFNNNNVDTCARVCHSPTGYGLKVTFGEAAGTQDFKSTDKTDVMLVIGCNPTDAHPVFGSRMKKRLREGAKLIVIDPRRIELVDSPHVKAAYHLQLMPGTNVAVVNALCHVIATENLIDRKFVNRRCEKTDFFRWEEFIKQPEHSPEAVEQITGVPAQMIREAARLYALGGNAAIYYGLGVTEHTQGSTTVMALANLAMATGNIGREGVGVNPLRGQNNVQGSSDMGSAPHEYPGYRHVSNKDVRELYEKEWNLKLDDEPGLRIPNMFDAAIDGTYRGMFIHGEDIAQSDPDTHHVEAALKAMDIVVVQDLFLNETAAFAHVFLPGTSFLEKDGTFVNAERRVNRVRKVLKEKQGMPEWEIVSRLATAMGYSMHYNSASEVMDEIARTTPPFEGVSYERLDELGSVQWPCNEQHPTGTPIMHMEEFVRGKGRFMLTAFMATDERASNNFPLILTTGRILSQYNVGAQTRRTDNTAWHPEDILEINQYDAEIRGLKDGQIVSLTSRAGATTIRLQISDRMPQGVVYTTFHHPGTGANLITTSNSDWATNCPEYKVTAVQVTPSNQPSDWQAEWNTRNIENKRIGTEKKLEPAE